jgi:hypothetical protein
MKKLLPMLLVPAFGLVMGCVDPPEKTGETPEFCNGTSCETLPEPVMTGVFVSGHLGNYRDCPGDGWSEGPVVGGANRVSPQGDIAEGACAPDSNCEPILNCQDAAATINLTNSGESLASGVQVDRVDLFDDNGELVASLPVLEVSEDFGSFDGELDVDETITLMIDFQGPQNPYDLLQTATDSDGDARLGASSSGTLRVIISADNHDAITVEGKEIFAVPSVDT